LILSEKPDAVVLATGVEAFVPEISGLEKAGAVQAVDVLSEKAGVGKKVVVIGGDLVGCETADFLSERGKDVTVTRRGKRMAVKVMPGLRPALLERLEQKNVTLLTGVRYEAYTTEGLVITDREGRRTLEADTIVLAAGSQPGIWLMETLQGRVPAVFSIGDCVEPRGILEAIHEGARIGRQI
jgi:pyruvate/2-oxoglutarate dehydrogenase complex dihydrolipoamide dehydrogenase (E3) component